MIRAGTGLATGEAADEAAIEASIRAVEEAGGSGGQVAFVFTTVPRPLAHPLLHAVRRVTGARAIVGCSGPGVLTGQGEVEGAASVAVALLDGDGFEVAPFCLQGLDPQGPDAGLALAEAFATTLPTDLVVLLPDVRSPHPSLLLGGLERVRPGLPVVGGIAAGEPPYECFETEVQEGALVGVALAGVEVVIGVAQGCQPIGEPFVITQAEEHVISQIGGRPALEVLREAILSLDNPQERLRRGGVFAGLAVDPAKSPLGRGDYLVRNIAGIDQSSGAVAVAERVRVGQTIQFQLRDAASAREDLRAVLEGLARSLGGRRPALGLYFNCLGRGVGLFGQPDHDVTLIREHLGAFPLIGFFGNGELAPIGRRNFLHNYTGALALLLPA